MPKGRLLDDWLLGHLEYTRNSESPVSFHAWAGIACICSALQRRVYMRWGHTTIYPNEYIVLVGPSGRARKGEPVTIARDITDELRIPRIGEDNSKEAVVLDLENSMTSWQDPQTNNINFQCAVYCFVEEWSVLLGDKDGKFLGYLTNWYDCRKDWKRTTKHQGTNEIAGVCFNMLASTAPDWIPMILPREAIGGGFTSRCMFIVEERKGKVVTNPNLYPPNRHLKRKLIADLETMTTACGEVVFDSEALALYEAWYEAEEEKINGGDPAVKDPIFAGYVSRRATHIKKLGMALSFARDNELVVRRRDLERALKMMEDAEKKMPRAFVGIGRARYIEETELVLDYVRSMGKITKSKLLRDLYRQVDEFTLDAVMRVLQGMKAIAVERDREEHETIYHYRG